MKTLAIIAYTSDLKQKIFDTCKNICGEELENTYRSNIRTQLCIKVERKYLATAFFKIIYLGLKNCLF